MRTRRTFRRRTGCGRAFTIVEVLATLSLAAVVLPAVVHGVQLCLATADHAVHQARAASLAQSKLAELVATGDLYDAEMAGDFGQDLPEYTWAAQVNEWEDSRLMQVDVAVMWTSRGKERHVALSTLVYTGTPNE